MAREAQTRQQLARPVNRPLDLQSSLPPMYSPTPSSRSTFTCSTLSDSPSLPSPQTMKATHPPLTSGDTSHVPSSNSLSHPHSISPAFSFAAPMSIPQNPCDPYSQTRMFQKTNGLPEVQTLAAPANYSPFSLLYPQQVSSALGLSFEFQPEFAHVATASGDFDAAATPFGYSGPHLEGMDQRTWSNNPMFITPPVSEHHISPSALVPNTEESEHAEGATGAAGFEESLECPPSPLVSVVASSTIPSPVSVRSSSRRRSEVGPTHVDEDATHPPKRNRPNTQKSQPSEGPNVSEAQKNFEIEELARLESLGSSASAAKRRLQNRLAQRSFRARGKLLDEAAAVHLDEVEKRAEKQAGEITRMKEDLEKMKAKWIEALETIRCLEEEKEKLRLGRR